MFVKILAEQISILKISIFNDVDDSNETTEKIVTIKNGDIVKFTYYKKGALELIEKTGRVKEIYGPTDFAFVTDDYSIEIDCSTSYHSYTERIILENVRDIELIKEEWDDPIEDQQQNTIPHETDNQLGQGSDIPDGD